MLKIVSKLLFVLTCLIAVPAFAEDTREYEVSGEIRSLAELEMLLDELDPARLADPLPELDPKNRSGNLIGYWRCDAWPVTVPGFNYYWLHTNVAVARFNALSLCVANFGAVCNYWCRFGY